MRRSRSTPKNLVSFQQRAFNRSKHLLFQRNMSFTVLLLMGGLALNSCNQPEVAGRPNIILLISDDQSWPDYSFLGHGQIVTPRIDQLAEEGLTFTQGYTTAPLCRPALASIITGLYPHQHGAFGNDPEGVHPMIAQHPEVTPAIFDTARVPLLKILIGPKIIIPHEPVVKSADMGPGYALVVSYDDERITVFPCQITAAGIRG